MTVEGYLKSKGFAYSSVGDNWNFDCPFCSDGRQRCGIHKQTYQFNCFNCEEKGSFNRFQKLMADERVVNLELLPPGKSEKTEVKIRQDLADKFQKKLSVNGRKAYTYLTERRGFKEETIEYFQLGSWRTKGYEYVSIPFWERGRLVNVKYRAIDYKDKKYKWRRQKGGKSSLFHDDVCDQKEYKDVFITEAELDCISLFNVGIKNVLSVSTGAKGFKQEWYEKLVRFKRIYTVFDNDVAGQEGARKIAERLGLGRVYNVKLPDEVKDLNEFFWDFENRKPNFNKTAFKKLVKDARKFTVPDVCPIEYGMKDLIKDIHLGDQEELGGFLTPWDRVNRILAGGSRPGHLVGVCAKPKTGKTTFVLNWMRFLAIRHDVPVGIYECEMKPKGVAERFVAMYDKDFIRGHFLTELTIQEANLHLPDNRIYIARPPGQLLDLDHVCETISQMHDRYGVKLVCFDNLHFLVRGDNVRDKIGEVTRRFKLLAEALNILFILIIHPKKVGPRPVVPEDMKDSGSIHADVDTTIILNRSMKDKANIEDDEVEMDMYDSLCHVDVGGRWCEGGSVTLLYDGRRALFHEKGTMYQKAIEKMKIEKNKQALRRRRGTI